MTTGTPLVLFNSLSRAAEPFEPIEPGTARVYSCGPTVYARQHLGNMRAYLFTDTLTRVLRWKGYAVTHVVNITDVGHLTSDADAGDDKIERAAAAERLTARQVADRYTELFKADLAKLNVREPSRWSLATDHIDDMIAFATRIEAAGSTYALESGLYFDVTTVPDYGALARQTTDAAGTDITEGRIELIEEKRHGADFALWRRSDEPGRRQMEWPSPWGVGAPGWHLECSVMSMKYLGTQFDIHTGGIDHREIHHPNEIAQNQAFTGTANTGANIWMHNNFLVEHGTKMSKSSGGFATLDTLIDAGVHPLAYRMLCLSAHYRSELDFSAANVLAALTRLKRLVILIEELRRGAATVSSIDPRLDSQLLLFGEAMSNDLNTPRALTHLDSVFEGKHADVAQKLAAIAEMDETLGLRLTTLTRADLRIRPTGASLSDDAVEALLAERKAARAARDFVTGDALRDRLAAAGVEIMDGDPLGWDWRPRLG